MGSSTYLGGSHLIFRKLQLKKGKKMHEYAVMNNKFLTKIGKVHWRGGWRQYVFQSLPGVDMSRSCNKEVNRFIDEIMKKWRKKRK